jgi:transporter family-2 protein
VNQTIALLCILAGCATAVQGGLNRRIADLWGASPTILLNGLSLCVAASLTIWLASRSDSPFASLIGPTPGGLTRPYWWYLVPGLLGFFGLMVMPGAIAKIGVTQVFVLILAGQLLTALVWDKWIEGMSISLSRIAGVSLVFVGSWLSGRS